MRASTGIVTAACAVFVGISGTVAAQGRARPRTPMRFAEMDRNGDGVITRAEWRGSDKAFRVHDWNGDGILSGDEVRPGARQRDRASGLSDEEFGDWTDAAFNDLDRNRDDRITRDEWRFDSEAFRLADHNGDGVITRREFLGYDTGDSGVRFQDLDRNRDGRITRSEWRGSAGDFDLVDVNGDGIITPREMTEPPPDLFAAVDSNRDGSISRAEWRWSRASFDERDSNRDGRLTRGEFPGGVAGGTPRETGAYRAGYDRGLSEGRSAGREDRERHQGWDLEGQRELESADSGYEPRLGSRADYQAGYREGFRLGYGDGYGR